MRAKSKNRLVSNIVEGHEVLLLGLLSYCNWILMNAELGEQSIRAANISLAATLFLSLTINAYRKAAEASAHIWTIHFWFRITCAVYFAFGAAAPYFFNYDTEAFFRSVYDYDGRTIQKILTIYTVSIFCIFLATYTSERILGPIRSRSTRKLNTSIDQTGMMLLFLLVGGAIRYGLVLPESYGYRIPAVPGGVLFIGNAYLAGLFLALVIGMRRGGGALFLAILLFVLDVIALGILTFSKLEVLRTLLFGFLAFAYHRVNIPRMFVAMFALFWVFSALQPFIHYGRSQTVATFDGVVAVSLDDRLGIASDYFSGNAIETERWSKELQAFSRLSYINTGAFVVDEYDAGIAGSSMRYAFVALVPRALWPDKPVIGSLGAELYILMRGHEGAWFSAGYFAETYWNFGWLGIPLVFLPVGVLFTLISRYSIVSIIQQNWVRFPAILAAIQIGIRTDGHFALDVMGLAATFVALAILTKGAEIFLTRPDSKTQLPYPKTEQRYSPDRN